MHCWVRELDRFVLLIQGPVYRDAKGGGDGVPVHREKQEDEGEPERSRDRAIKIPMIGVC